MPENKKFWKFCNQAGNKVELLLYGDISQTSWWGDEVTPKQFAEELAGLGALDEITVRINSGGDVFAAQAIGNQLEQHPAAVTAKIDGLCASAATIVACHCGKVIAANDSTYMVHPVRMGAYGYYNAEELQKYIEAMNAIRESIVGLYVKKTGRDKDEVAGWMDETSWWTAAQAKENGFIDELTDEAVGTVIENRDGLMFVNSVNTHLPFDKAPNFVQSSKAAPASCSVNNKCHKEVTNMANEIKTVDENDAEVSRQLLASFARMMPEYKVDTALRFGNPGPEIIGFAKEGGFDAILMTRSSRGCTQKMGSVSTYIVRNASFIDITVLKGI